jgi:FkbM family methyltransferase
MVERLLANIEFNRLNVTIMPVALSNARDTASLYAGESDSFHQGRSSLKSSDGLTREISIKKTSGKVLQEQISDRPVSFFKIDIEGHENGIEKSGISVMDA